MNKQTEVESPPTGRRNNISTKAPSGAWQGEIVRDWLAESDFAETGNLGDVQVLLSRLSALRL